jgi:hypothetical protein
MLCNPKYRGLYVVVRRESDGEDLFRWNIYRRKTPLGVRLTEAGFTSFRAAHAAGSKALAELVQSILEEERNGVTSDGPVPVRLTAD